MPLRNNVFQPKPLLAFTPVFQNLQLSSLQVAQPTGMFRTPKHHTMLQWLMLYRRHVIHVKAAASPPAVWQQRAVSQPARRWRRCQALQRYRSAASVRAMPPRASARF